MLYKVLNLDGTACHGGWGRWTPGRWRSVSGPLVPCERGLHLCRADQFIAWLGPALWEAEVDGEVVDASDKLVARRARITRRVEAWDERTARLFAADCAERVLPLWEVRHPNDDRPRRAIETARRLVQGTASADELAVARAAAGAAARDAARAAARAAARDAARAAAWDAARAAAWDAARAAARDAARAAARAAAGAAACAAARAAAWDAARAAARAVAWDAARDAARAAARDPRPGMRPGMRPGDAAWAATWDAAWAAAWAAGEAAERRWQSDHLMELLGLAS